MQQELRSQRGKTQVLVAPRKDVSNDRQQIWVQVWLKSFLSVAVERC